MLKLVIISVFSFLYSSFSSAADDCSNRPDQLAHLSSIQRAICEKALAAGYTMEEAGCGNPDVGWFNNRDNNYTEIDTATDNSIDGTVGKAMATIISKAGTSQAIQVCPGVYLSTAHGVLDDPSKIKNNEREVRTPSHQRVYAISYPLDKENLMKASTDAQYSSPLIDNPDGWGDPNNDFVFITVDEGTANRKDHFVRPVEASASEFFYASLNSDIEPELFRGKTKFELNQNGTPDHNKTTAKQTYDELQTVYDKPIKINEKCNLVESHSEQLGTDCPSEISVSGSPMITKLNNEPLLMGVMRAGYNKDFNILSKNNSNHMITSAKFCQYYEKACSQKCVTLEDKLEKPFEDVSL